ncbi:hypothetical protein M3Y98_01030400 [Aphelenchoides besseyi]|nr:hypothetical protein M3Y98_01030400 [Aphelenchoides besseyi]KAI6209979.1 hypothetical protein M3Y96_00278300 [Aphelenchoides besseyi]
MESNRTVDENTRLDLSDCSLWRTKVNSTQFVEDADEKTLETNLALTDCSLWRTRVRGSDAFADTNPRPSDVQSVNRTRFEVTDNSLRRTRIRESSASGESDSGVSAVSQTVAETQQQPTSPVAQKTHFEVTDNSLYRTQMRVSEVPVADEMEEETNEEEKTIRSPPAAEVARCVPNDSHFNENSILSIDLDETIHKETFGQSFVAGVSDYDSDVASPAPKHIVLRKPAKKAEKYLRAVKPKILIGADEIRDQHPELRRSSRTRLGRPYSHGLGERPIYGRDSQGNICLIGVQEGRMAGPLCKKWRTFDNKAINMDKAAEKRRRYAIQLIRERWRRDVYGL